MPRTADAHGKMKGTALKAEVGFADQDITVTTPANKRALDAQAMEARMDAVRLKQILGGALTDQERMCLQIEQNGFGCGGSSSPGGGGSSSPTSA